MAGGGSGQQLARAGVGVASAAPAAWRLANDPSLTSGSSLAGPLLSLGSSFVQDPAAKAALSTAGYGLGAVSNPFMAAWGAPGFVSGLYSIFNGGEHDSGDALLRRFSRTRDAMGLERGVVGPLAAAKTPEDMLAALRSSVGGATAGDALASILRFNEDGTWYTDTDHRWRPDPFLRPAQSALRRLGYEGDVEPKAGYVGGAGEMVMGGSIVAPWMPAAKEHYDADGGYSWSEPDYRAGPRGWDALLRELSGVPRSAPSVWDFDRPVMTAPGAEPGVSNPVPGPAADYQKYSQAAISGESAALSDSSNSYVQYLNALPDDVAAKLRATEIARAQQLQALQAMATSMGG